MDALVLVCLSAIMLAVCYVHEFRALGGPGPTLDDTFIHLRFASNLARGHGFSFNPGQQLPGSTSPLWVVMLTPFARGSKEFMVGASLVLSSLSYLPLGVLAWMLARRLGASRAIGLTAGALVALSGRLLWAGMSGMETDLFAALSMLGFIVYLGEQKNGRMSWRVGLILGLAANARPEGYMMFIGVVIHHLLSRAREDGFSRRAMLGAVPWAAIVVFAALIAPYMIFSVATSGSPLPTTFAAKSVDFSWLRGRYLRFTALYFWLDNPGAALVLVPATALAAVRVFRERLGFLASGDGLVTGWAFGYLAVSVGRRRPAPCRGAGRPGERAQGRADRALAGYRHPLGQEHPRDARQGRDLARPGDPRWRRDRHHGHRRHRLLLRTRNHRPDRAGDTRDYRRGPGQGRRRAKVQGHPRVPRNQAARLPRRVPGHVPRTARRPARLPIPLRGQARRQPDSGPRPDGHIPLLVGTAINWCERRKSRFFFNCIVRDNRV